MTGRGNWTWRRLLGASAGVIAAAVGGAPLRSALAAPAIMKGSKLTYWGGLIFSDEANKLLVDTINKWGADNGVDTEVVMINQNETVQKVSAAVASNTMPDALDLGLDLLLLLSRQGSSCSVDDVYPRHRRRPGRLVSEPSPRRPTRPRSPAGAPAFRSASPATCSCAATTCWPAGLHQAARRPGRSSPSRPPRSTSRRSSASAWRSPMSATATCRSRCCSPMAAASPTTPARRRPSSPTRPGPI